MIMNAQKILRQIREAPSYGKIAYVKDKFGRYCIFFTPDEFGLRERGWCSSLERAKELVDREYGYTDEEIIERTEEGEWQVGYIDISEFFDRSGYKVDMKVRNVKTGEVGEITSFHFFNNGVQVEQVEFENLEYRIVSKHWFYENIEPVYEDEEEDKYEELRRNVGDDIYYKLTPEQRKWIIENEGSIDLGKKYTEEDFERIKRVFKIDEEVVTVGSATGSLTLSKSKAKELGLI